MRREFDLRGWLPTGILAIGCLTLVAAKRQTPMPLLRPLGEVVPPRILGATGVDLPIAAEERKISGVSNFVLRVFGEASSAIRFSIYVGYYEAQLEGKTIHSPKNCLPGAGWEPVASARIRLEVNGYSFPVNRYVLAKGNNQAVVYYWYQGRGRISANEYLVKWEQLRDRALAGRSDEALVRVVVPARSDRSLGAADSAAVEISKTLVDPLFLSLPGFAGRPTPSASAPGIVGLNLRNEARTPKNSWVHATPG
jgi:EpsI family protein